MSKLTIVRQALERNPDIDVVNVLDSINIQTISYPSDLGGWAHTVIYAVAPKRGLYTAEELQRFMDRLIPGVEPTTRDDFREEHENLLFGKLYFDEEIGPVRKTLTLEFSDEELKDSDGFDGKRTVIDEVYKGHMRRIFVAPYPNSSIARKSASQPMYFIYSAERKELERYRSRIKV